MNRNNSMIYTPNRRIPVGEAILSESGVPVLLVKKSHSAEMDAIPLDLLIKQMVDKAEGHSVLSHSSKQS